MFAQRNVMFLGSKVSLKAARRGKCQTITIRKTLSWVIFFFFFYLRGNNKNSNELILTDIFKLSTFCRQENNAIVSEEEKKNHRIILVNLFSSIFNVLIDRFFFRNSVYYRYHKKKLHISAFFFLPIT